MSHFGSLVAGFRLFKATMFEEQRELIKHLVRQSVTSKIMVVACSDMRIAPGKVFNSNPGDLYVVRNVGALIPPFEETGANGIMAAIEYGIVELEVETVVVLGHANCDAIHYHMNGTTKNTCESVTSWLKIIDSAKQAIQAQLSKKSAKVQTHACEFESILVSMRNLLGYPSVQKRIEDGNLDLYGWHFDIQTGKLKSFDPEIQQFELIE